MKVIGYGEDSMTLWALTNRDQMGAFLKQLADASTPEAADVFYRPSFGRGGSPACFGEFDAIVCTTNAVYLVEAKRSAPRGSRTIKLESPQLDRHKIFEWYLREWRRRKPQSWAEFLTSAKADFTKTFPKKAMPEPPSSLAEHLRHLLTEITQGPHGVDIQNVLLLFELRDKNQSKPVLPEGFKLVALAAEEFVELSQMSVV